MQLTGRDCDPGASTEVSYACMDLFMNLLCNHVFALFAIVYTNQLLKRTDGILKINK